MTEIVCIECPKGCILKIGGESGKPDISGYSCPRGKDFALSEIISPMRTLSSTVRTVFSDTPVVPVKVSAEIPKSRIFDVMHEIHKVRLGNRLGSGDVVIGNVLGLGVEVVLTSNMLREF